MDIPPQSSHATAEPDPPGTRLFFTRDWWDADPPDLPTVVVNVAPERSSTAPPLDLGATAILFWRTAPSNVRSQRVAATPPPPSPVAVDTEMETPAPSRTPLRGDLLAMQNIAPPERAVPFIMEGADDIDPLSLAELVQDGLQRQGYSSEHS